MKNMILKIIFMNKNQFGLYFPLVFEEKVQKF